MDVSASSSAAEVYEWTPCYDLPTTVAPNSAEHAEPTTKTGILSKVIDWTARAFETRRSLQLSPLCRQCQSIFSGPRPDSVLGGPHNHPLNQTLDQMERSAVDGCSLCRMRCSQLSEADLSRLSRTHDIKVGYWESRVGNGLAFQYPLARAANDPFVRSVAFVADQNFSQTIKFSQMRKMEAFGPRLTEAGLVYAPSTANRPSSIEMIKNWIQDCIEHHITCRELRPASPQLPTRLIDIGGGEVIRPVLCSTHDLPPSTPYVTLSHCWGGKEFLRLLKENLRSFCRRISVCQLSKTFRDAMEVTFRLGIRYIWIDSLCIIQDSAADWSEQAALMGEVYRNAFCNIAATTAKDGDQGLFLQRTLLDVDPCQVEVKWAGRRRQTYFCHGIGTWEREVEKQPLLGRAWVAQEVILAPRVVHFSRTQVLWECLERRACESYVDKIPNFTEQKLSLRIRSKHNPPWLNINDGNFPYHEIWEDVVDLYSRGDLTFKTKDKLIAISGIARTLGLPADDYLAGLWKPGLLQQLLWVTVKPDTDSKVRPVRASEYRAPSWSWASIDGPVLTRTPTLQALQHACVEILEASTTLCVPGDPFGGVKDGIICIKGMLARAQFSERVVTKNTTPAFRNGKIVELPLGPGLPAQSLTQRFLGQAHVNIFLDDEDPKVGEFYHCLLTSQQFGGCGLLIKLTGMKRGEYTRCGYFAVLVGLYPDSPASFMELCRGFDAVARENKMLYEHKAGLAPNGIQQYIISLV